MLDLGLTTHVAAMAQGDVPAPLTAERQRIETSDFRASARLIRTDAEGTQTILPIRIEAHWFPGVLRELVEIAPARKSVGSLQGDARVRILFEMRPGGQSTIRVFHPNKAEPTPLPFANWDESVANSDFNMEDFLDAGYYWRGQILLEAAKFGGRDCEVLKSIPIGSDRSHYAEIETWIDRTTNYPIYVEKRPKGGGEVRQFTSLGLSKSGGNSYARQVEVRVHGRLGSTVLIVERGSAKANLSLKDFDVAQISRF